MTDIEHSTTPIPLPIGTADDVVFDVVAWGPAHADVDFSVACMFEHELGDVGIAGGLLALDQALGGQLTRLRATGAFRAQPMETLLVTLPPPGMVPRAVLVIGLGDPAVLDGGHTDNAALDMQHVMMDGMLGALRAEHMLADAGLAASPALRHCTFDVGAPRAQAAGLAFAAAFARLTAT